MSLESEWNEVDCLLDEEQNPFFYDCFCVNYSNISSKSVIQCVRERAVLGKTPSPFYNNYSESINKVINQHVHYQNSPLPVFVKDLYSLIEQQSNNMKKADMQTGDWHLKDQQEILHVPVIPYCNLV